MSIHDHLSLRQLRDLSGHSATWCAEHVGKVTLRSWNYWEAGTKQGQPVSAPDDVMAAMRELAEAVQSVLEKTVNRHLAE